MTSYRFADVVLVTFPFTDLTTRKKRPAVILHRSDYPQRHQDVILMAITSQIRMPLAEDEALIQDWSHAGLIKPSMLKPLIATLDQGLIIRKLGRLSQQDQDTLRTLLNHILDT